MADALDNSSQKGPLCAGLTVRHHVIPKSNEPINVSEIPEGGLLRLHSNLAARENRVKRFSTSDLEREFSFETRQSRSALLQ
jgi:hypothetical protein